MGFKESIALCLGVNPPLSLDIGMPSGINERQGPTNRILQALKMPLRLRPVCLSKFVDPLSILEEGKFFMNSAKLHVIR